MTDSLSEQGTEHAAPVALVQFPRLPIREVPKRRLVPADYGLVVAVDSLVYQCGQVNAYNKLLDAAERLLREIESGEEHKKCVLP